MPGWVEAVTGPPFIVRWRRAVIAADRQAVPMRARAVAFVLGQHFDGGAEPSCWLLISTIAREAGCGSRTVDHALAELRSAGLLESIGRGPKSSIYVARIPKEPQNLRPSSADIAPQAPQNLRTELDPGTRPGRSTTSAAHSRSRTSSATVRRRDPIFDALVEACGLDYSDMTDRERRACGVAAAELARLERPPARDEILRRAGRYPATYPDATMTPHAIAAHWAQLGAERPADRNARDLEALRRSLQVIEGGEPP